MANVAELHAPSKRGRLVKPVRVAPRPDRPFGEGLEDPPGLSCPIDSRPLPSVNGQGLEQHERWQLNAAYNQAFANHALDNPKAPLDECEAFARKVERAELTRVLKQRPAAPTLKLFNPEAVPMGTGRPEKRMPYTSADLAWWAAHSPTRNEGYEVVRRATRWESDWDRWHREAAPESAEVMESVGVLAGVCEPQY